MLSEIDTGHSVLTYQSCVADATDDLANQQIFTLAAEHVDSTRMIGVFTKCDQTQHPETVS
jgi:hypothetical protein